jgi:hypothetical protein
VVKGYIIFWDLLPERGISMKKISKYDNICLFFTGMNHLFILLNQVIDMINFNNNIFCVSGYDSEQLYLRWANLTERIGLDKLKKIKFLDKNEINLEDIKENDIIIIIDEEIVISERKCIKINCYELFLNKSNISEIVNKHDYIINSWGIFNIKDLLNAKN